MHGVEHSPTPIRIPSGPSTLPMFRDTPRPKSVTLAGMYQPNYGMPMAFHQPGFLAQTGKRAMGQLVTVNPNVQIRVETGLEKYMMPVGLIAGGAVSFIVGSLIPENWRVITTLAGLGLLGTGVYLLIRGPQPSVSVGPAAPPPPPPTGATPIESSPKEFTPPTVSAFNQLQIEMVSPQSDQEIESTGTFLGIGTPKIPVQMRMYNPSAESVTFNLDFEWDEYPSVIGYNQAPAHGSQSFQVTLGPLAEKNEPFELIAASGRFATLMNVGLTVYKKRTPAENRYLLMSRTFGVT